MDETQVQIIEKEELTEEEIAQIEIEMQKAMEAKKDIIVFLDARRELSESEKEQFKVLVKSEKVTEIRIIDGFVNQFINEEEFHFIGRTVTRILEGETREDLAEYEFKQADIIAVTDRFEGDPVEYADKKIVILK